MTIPMDTVLENRVRLLGTLGSGGFGQVYLGEQESLGRRVAVKVLTVGERARASELERFRREARLLATLAHGNIVAVHDFGSHEGMPYLVLEYVEGRTLREVLDERGALPAEEAAAHGAWLADALGYAHGRPDPVVHRDVKPANLMVDREGVLKVCDFGLASSATITRMTRAGARVGTPAYMSPEQCRGERAGPESDVFAAGGVLYEMLAGRRAFEAASVQGLYAKIAHGEPAPLRGVPGDLAELVTAMLAKEPADRPSAVEVAGRLRGAPRPPVPVAGESTVSGTRDDGTHDEVWRDLEDAERDLTAGRYAAADRRFAALAERLGEADLADHPGMFAAGWGRVRALHGLGRGAEADRRLRRLADRAPAALGPGHHLAVAIRAYAEL